VPLAGLKLAGLSPAKCPAKSPAKKLPQIAEASWEEIGSPGLNFCGILFGGALRRAFCGAEPASFSLATNFAKETERVLNQLYVNLVDSFVNLEDSFVGSLIHSLSGPYST